MACWSELAGDLLCQITEKNIKALKDVIWVQSVCKNWRLALKKKSIFSPQLAHHPWLMLPYFYDAESSSCDYFSRGVFSVLEKKTIHGGLGLPEIYGKRCVGSSHGWLAMVEDTSPTIFLINPLTRRRIELPPVTSFPDILDYREDKVGEEYVYLQQGIYENFECTMSLKDIENFYVYKIILSGDPISNEEDDCIVVALWGEQRRLSFCRVGDETWRWASRAENIGICIADVVYWGGKVYAVSHLGKLLVMTCNLESPFPVVKQIQNTLFPMNDSTMKYLVIDSFGKLLIIKRYVKQRFGRKKGVAEDERKEEENDNHEDEDIEEDEENEDEYEYEWSEDEEVGIDDMNNEYKDKEDKDFYDSDVEIKGDNYSTNSYYRTIKFKVYEFDEEEKSWKKVSSLHDNVLFLGQNCSQCLSALDFPECKRNCIYFADDHSEAYVEKEVGGQDFGIFDMEDGSINTLVISPSCSESSPLIWPPPIWVTPSLGLAPRGQSSTPPRP